MYEQAIQNMAMQIAQLSADNAIVKAQLDNALKQIEELQGERDGNK
jgi:hypothetical protein